MDDRSATEYFAELVNVLNRKSLNWVVNQVNDEIRFGKVESGDFLAVKEERRNGSMQTDFFDNREDFKIKKKETFNVIVPYSEKEKLKLLVSAMKRLLVDISDMENHIMDFFENPGEENKASSIIMFISEDESVDQFTLIKDEIRERKKNVEALRELLNELNKEIEHDNEN